MKYTNIINDTHWKETTLQFFCHGFHSSTKTFQYIYVINFHRYKDVYGAASLRAHPQIHRNLLLYMSLFPKKIEIFNKYKLRFQQLTYIMGLIKKDTNEFIFKKKKLGNCKTSTIRYQNLYHCTKYDVSKSVIINLLQERQKNLEMKGNQERIFKNFKSLYPWMSRWDVSRISDSNLSSINELRYHNLRITPTICKPPTNYIIHLGKENANGTSLQSYTSYKLITITTIYYQLSKRASVAITNVLKFWHFRVI